MDIMQEDTEILTVMVVTMATNPSRDDVKNALDTIFSLPQSELEKIITGAQQVFNSREHSEVNDTIPAERPNLKFPSYITITHAEWIMTEFIKELFNNYDEDYYMANENDATHDNSIIVTNSFNDIDEKIGQTPRIVVDVGQSAASQSFMANINAKASDFISPDTIKGKNSAALQLPISISVISPKKNECNILACMIQMAIIENMDLLREIFNIYKFTFPAVNGAKQIKDKGKLMMASVQLQMERYVSWSTVLKIKSYKNLYLRLNAYGHGDKTPPIRTIISSYDYPLDPQVVKMLDEMEKRFKD